MTDDIAPRWGQLVGEWIDVSGVQLAERLVLNVPRTGEQMLVLEVQGSRAMVRRGIGMLAPQPLQQGDDIVVIGSAVVPEVDLPSQTQGTFEELD